MLLTVNAEGKMAVFAEKPLAGIVGRLQGWNRMKLGHGNKAYAIR